MSRKSRYSIEDKVRCVKSYIEGKLSFREVTKQLGSVSRSRFNYWVALYRYHGASGLLPKTSNSTYTREMKYEIVNRYLSGESLNHLSVELIITPSVLRKWIKDYNSHIALKNYQPEKEIYMTESNRKVTLEEKIEAVLYCLAHHKNYKQTAKKYAISYRQIYTWVKKYEREGEKGLVDRRGKSKPEYELTELERLERENRLLKKILEEKEREQEILKKYTEFLMKPK